MDKYHTILHCILGQYYTPIKYSIPLTCDIVYKYNMLVYELACDTLTSKVSHYMVVCLQKKKTYKIESKNER